MRHVVLATRNPAKVGALGRWVAGWEVREAPANLDPDAPETGDSFAANAMAKAETVSSRLLGVIVVATDGGLLIPALGDTWDPLRTHRFAGSDATAADRARAILRLAADFRGAGRVIGWQEALAVAVDGQCLASWLAESPPGELAITLPESQLGTGHGFWVSSIWRCPEYGEKRLADLSPDEEATRRDHWVQLGAALTGWLRDWAVTAAVSSS